MGKRIFRWAALIILFLAIPLLVYQVRGVIYQNPFDKHLYFSNPSFITADRQSNMYVIDQSMKRITKISADGEVNFVIEGGGRESGSFYYATELAVNETGEFYVLNWVLDSAGALVEKEEILCYDAGGKYTGTLYRKEYPADEMPVRDGWISSISCRDGNIYCYFKAADGVDLYTIPLDGGTPEEKRIFSLADARLMLVDVKGAAKENKFVYSTKKGEIYTFSGSGDPVLLYSVAAQGRTGGASIPWKLNMDSSGGVYFSDLGERKIFSLSGPGSVPASRISTADLEELGAQDLDTFRQFYVGEEGGIYTLNGNNIVFRSAEGTIAYCGDTAAYSVLAMVYRFLVWLLVLLWLVVLVLLLRRIYVDIMGRSLPKATMQILVIFITVIITAGIVANMIFNSLLASYEKKVLDNLCQTTQMASAIIDGDTIQRINNLGDYMNDDYNTARKQLFKVFNDNQDSWNTGQYGVIYHVRDNKVFALMFYDDSIGTFYPIDFDYSNSKYEPVFSRGEIKTVKESDVTGDWIYALGPVYNSKGEITAVVEVGTDLYEFTEANKKLIKDIILNVITILIIFIFALTELSIFGNVLSSRKTGSREYLGEAGGVDIVRPLGFLMFTGTFMSTSFIPVFMKEMYQPIAGLPESVVLGLPISAEMLFVALFSVLAGYLIDSRGWRPVFLGGMLVLAVGMLLSGLTHNQLVFILARAIVGAGFGLAIIALQAVAMGAPTEDEKNRGISSLTSGIYSGMNVGVVVGAMLAEWSGFSNVFFVAMVMVVAAAFYAYKMVPNIITRGREAVKEKVSVAEVGRFFANINVLGFFLLIFIPVSICGMFLSYFFPLFAEEAGVSASNTGRAFLLNGMCIVYLGPFLTRYIGKYLGPMKAVVVYGVLVAGAMLAFGLRETLGAAFMAVILLGIADSFGIALLLNYFSELRATNRLGQGKAIGYYSLVEYVGQMLGPIALGFLILIGVGQGLTIVGIAMLAAILLFMVIARREKPVGQNTEYRIQKPESRM